MASDLAHHVPGQPVGKLDGKVHIAQLNGGKRPGERPGAGKQQRQLVGIFCRPPPYCGPQWVVFVLDDLFRVDRFGVADSPRLGLWRVLDENRLFTQVATIRRG